MSVSVARGVPRYRCQPAANGGCGGVSIVLANADDAARDKVLNYLDSAAFAKALDRHQRAATKTDSRLGHALAALSKDRARLAELADWLADGTLDAPEYRRQRDRLRARIADAEATVVRSTPAAAPTVDLAGQGALLRQAWEKMIGDERRQVLAAVVERFVIDAAALPTNRWNPQRVRPVWRFG